ncbi:hypothetical protein ACQEVC_42380 [Plantactinospora sp. CA-294935]|uniref:hypothetical protein n=1 Tax=Plantactinospora sp. CA-294935 TaxID=3240012 RepID=UPI003D942A15
MSDENPGGRRADRTAGPDSVGYGLAVCGAGPAGTGPFVAAARDGRLDELLDLGVVMIERRTPGSGGIGRYRIHANSLGNAFLEGVDGIAGGPLGWLAECPEARQLRAYAHRHPPLSLVGPFLDRVGEAVAGVLRAHPRCTVLTGTAVEEIDCLPGGGVAIRAVPEASGPVQTVTAARALIAMGADPDDELRHLDQPLDTLLGPIRDRTVHADHLIDRTRRPLTWLLRRIEQTGRLVIVGSSHSAWSVAHMLHRNELGGDTRGTDICMLARSDIRLLYGSASEARSEAYPFSDSDICPLSGRVNRYGGLRGPARDLARATLGLTEEPSPVRIVPLRHTPADTLREEFHRAGAVVLATGHRARLPRLRNPHAQDIVPLHANGGTVVNDLGHLVAIDGTTYPQFTLYGLGAGLRPSAAIGGEPSFHRRATGVWLYQNHFGSVLTRDLLSTGGRRAVCELPA